MEGIEHLTLKVWKKNFSNIFELFLEIKLEKDIKQYTRVPPLN